MALAGNVALQQLERMGRELKCPICLSLFHQAALLSCNHCFCKSCILTSLKGASECPVCRVPAYRREVRPSPQTDNLVAIYRGMEAAAGVPMFASQPFEEDVSEEEQPTKVTKKRASPNIDPSKTIPAKKRIQAPQVLASDEAENVTERNGVSKHHATEKDESECKQLKAVEKQAKVSKTIPVEKPKQAHQAEADNEKVITTEAEENLEPEKNERKQLKKRGKNKASAAAEKLIQLEADSKNVADNKPGKNDEKPDETKGPKAVKKRGRKPKASTKVLAEETEQENDKSSRNKKRKQSSTDDQTGLNSKEALAHKGEAVSLAPFFWLSPDEEEEEEHQHQEEQAIPDDSTMQPSVPAFSDLKSSDHDHVKELEAEEVTNVPDSEEINMHCSIRDLEKMFVDDSQDPYLTIAEFLANDAESREQNKVQRSGTGAQQELQQRESIQGSKASKASKVSKPLKAPEKLKASPEKTSPILKPAPDAAQLDPPKAPAASALIKTCGNSSRAEEESSKPLIEKKHQKVPRNKASKQAACAFCHQSDNSPLMKFKNGCLVPLQEENASSGLLVHRLCAEWAPNVYFPGEDEGESIEVKNLKAEVARSQKLKCSSCGLKGAALGCVLKRCRKTFHFPCAKKLTCKWDEDEYLLLCPDHAHDSFPGAGSKQSGENPAQKLDSKQTPGFAAQNFEKNVWKSEQSRRWTLCGSGLDADQKVLLKTLASVTGAALASSCDQSVTHVIAGTDSTGAAKRTKKFQLGVLQGVWIVKPEWMIACLSAGQPVNEASFEITGDNRGVLDGPKRGRLQKQTQAPRLFEGLSFYFAGKFEGKMKLDLQALVGAAGGSVLNRKPINRSSSVRVIYPDESSAQIREEASSIANSTSGVALKHSWILDSIAGYKLQAL